MPRPVLVIHGGAGSHLRSEEKKALLRESIHRILLDVFPMLERGASALTAVTEAVVRLEDDPLFNAGKGSKIQSDGHIRLSASIMDGAIGRFGACVNVEGVKNPVRLAKALMKRQDRTLAEHGAKRFAEELGLPFASPFTEQQMRLFRKGKKGKTGTVGAVALDERGRLAAATSTGGKGNEYPHRVSDTPTVAANYANDFAAVSATGIGEEIVEFAVASRICVLVESGIPLHKCGPQLIRRVIRKGAGLGFIALDKKGNVLARRSTPSMVWGSARIDEFEIGF